MNKKNQNKIAFNILNLLRLEKSYKNRKGIPFPISKFKPSFSSSILYLNNTKKQKNTNKNIQTKNSNNKNTISFNKPKQITSNKTSDLIQSNKVISKQNNDKNNNLKNKNINQINISNNLNIISHLGQNAIDYFVYSSNSLQKKRCSNSVHDQRKKVINDIYSKKHNKEKEINCLKLSSNNTNSTCVNSNNTNNFNSKSKYKSTYSVNIEEMQKENKKLMDNIEIIGKENKTLNKKINKLRNKNIELRNILYSLKKEKDQYSTSISQSLKLLKLLKKNGLELTEIIDNLSNSDSENEEENEQEENIINYYNDEEDDNMYDDDKKNKKGCFSENNKDDKDDKNEDSEYTDISFGRLECHEEFSIKKIPKGLKYIPKLKIYNINNEKK